MSQHVVVAGDFGTMLRRANAKPCSPRSPDNLLSRLRTFCRIVEFIARRSVVLRSRQLTLARRPAGLTLVAFRRQSLKRKLRLADLLQALAPMSDVHEHALEINRVFSILCGAVFEQVFVEWNGSIIVDSSVIRIMDRCSTRNLVVEVQKPEPGHFPELLIDPEQIWIVACRCAIGKSFGVLICKTIELMPNRGAWIFTRVNDIKVERSVVVDWNYRQRVKSVSGIVASVGILRFRFGLKSDKSTVFYTEVLLKVSRFQICVKTFIVKVIKVNKNQYLICTTDWSSSLITFTINVFTHIWNKLTFLTIKTFIKRMCF